MRVAHLITRLVVGGAQENTVASVLGLRAKPGLEVRLLAGPTRGSEGSLESLVAAPPGLLTVIPALVRPVHPWQDLRALRQLRRWLCEWRPDLVHTHSGKAGILGRLAARQAGVRVIIHTIHGPSFGDFQGALANSVFRAAERRAARWTTHFVSVAQAMTDQYLAAGMGRREQFTRIFSGFALEPYRRATNNPELRARLGLAPGDFVVGKLARLFRLKGHEDLFAVAPELARRCPRLRFLLIGDGPLRERFRLRTQELGVADKFRFVGLVPPDEVARYIGVMDALVHLSRREGLPRALPQALAAAKPVVAYDCDGAREVCRDGETGFLVRPGDLAMLVERVVRLAAEPALGATLGQRGQALVQEWFPVEKMVEALCELYARLGSRASP